jgi:hypothetical protein
MMGYKSDEVRETHKELIALMTWLRDHGYNLEADYVQCALVSFEQEQGM